MTEIKLYRLVGYDKEGRAYDITRSINIDTEQFINQDISDIKVSEKDRTHTINISRQEKLDLKKEAEKDDEESEIDEDDEVTITN